MFLKSRIYEKNIFKLQESLKLEEENWNKYVKFRYRKICRYLSEKINISIEHFLGPSEHDLSLLKFLMETHKKFLNLNWLLLLACKNSIEAVKYIESLTYRPLDYEQCLGYASHVSPEMVDHVLSKVTKPYSNIYYDIEHCVEGENMNILQYFLTFKENCKKVVFNAAKYGRTSLLKYYFYKNDSWKRNIQDIFHNCVAFSNRDCALYILKVCEKEGIELDSDTSMRSIVMGNLTDIADIFISKITSHEDLLWNAVFGIRLRDGDMSMIYYLISKGITDYSEGLESAEECEEEYACEFFRKKIKEEKNGK